jgi:hypothetical protein
MALIRLLLLASLINPNIVYAEIGSITEFNGSGLVERQEQKIDADLSLNVEMNDHVQTAKGEVGITFDDETQVHIGEHSELVIDDFVYDPATSQGSLGLNVAMGTVKYASGNIAHSNPDTVDIQTPSATIAVRGTAFYMTVDEIGKSLIILVPNFDGSVGSIVVSTDSGQVLLNKAFQATLVTSKANPPSTPKVLDITDDQINNLLIISKPRFAKEEEESHKKTSTLDINELDKNLLDFNELNVDELKFDDLTINSLEAILLENELDIAAIEVNTDGIIAGVNQVTGVITVIDAPAVNVVRFGSKQVANYKFDENEGVDMILNQGSTTINILTLEEQSSNNVRIMQQ